MRFPSSSSKLFNLVSREVLEQLTTLQVSASLLHRKDQVRAAGHAAAGRARAGVGRGHMGMALSMPYTRPIHAVPETVGVGGRPCA